MQRTHSSHSLGGDEDSIPDFAKKNTNFFLNEDYEEKNIPNSLELEAYL